MQVHGYAEQGAAFGYTRQRGLHFQIVTASTPIAPPVIVASRLRKVSAGSAKGAAHLIAEAVNTVRAMGATGQIIARRLRVLLAQDRDRLPPPGGALLLHDRPGQEDP